MLRWRALLAVAAVTLLIILIISPSLPAYTTTHAGYTKVMVEFIGSTEHWLQYLSGKGYDIEPIEVLSNVADGAILYIRPDQVGMLRQECMVKRVSLDEEVMIVAGSQIQPQASSYSSPHSSPISPTSFEIVGLSRVEGMRDGQGRALTGEGVKVAIIDTGVDYTRSDLYGLGSDGKVIAGYDFLEKDDDPLDVDGHGTAVAGIIAADGGMKGIAPKARLLAYKIASGNNYTSSLDIVRALERAARDGADIVNISIGMDRVNEDIDNAVNSLVRKGIVVVAAAGNSGQNGMGSPATARDAITVGATLSTPSNVIATLRINDTRFEAIPMLGSVLDRGDDDGVVKGELVYANFATARDVEGLDLNGKIVLAERGGPVQVVNGVERREVVYFSDKERNVASKGAIALIVYNNEPGAFYGTLIHENNSSDYRPRIPVVSISREDGLRIREMLAGGVASIELRILSKPDLVASFSSKGPVSPFYIKPDLVAPGTGINSTGLNGTYVMNSGTSFAAPHVSGAAALILQKYPDLRPEEVASLLVTTAEPVTDPYDKVYPLDSAGAGRLAVDRALSAEFVALPHSLMFYLNPGERVSKSITLRVLDDSYRFDEGSVSVRWVGDGDDGNDDGMVVGVDTDIQMDGRSAVVHLTVAVDGKAAGRHEGRLVVSSGSTTLSIPVAIYINPLAMHVKNSDGMLLISLDGGDVAWKSARIKVTDAASMKSRMVTLTPDSRSVSVPVINRGEYWIDASVITNNGTLKVLSTVDVSNVGKGVVLVESQSLPLRELVIIVGFVGVVTLIAFVLNRRHGDAGDLDGGAVVAAAGTGIGHGSDSSTGEVQGSGRYSYSSAVHEYPNQDPARSTTPTGVNDGTGVDAMQGMVGGDGDEGNDYGIAIDGDDMKEKGKDGGDAAADDDVTDADDGKK
ncbi:MAG: S8 family serine peptidase [Candidatus Nitrosocaldus sp.]|nr:S8 family serine peptidase [Candidatus Nitrosocaldus sp.]